MHLKVVIFALSFLTASASPLRRESREATWPESNVNQAHDKKDLPKDADVMYKTHIDSSGLYNEDDYSKSPMTEDMQRKLIMESERLRARLRQELSELQRRLSPTPEHLSATLANMRDRLAPLTQQLQSSLSSNTQDLCSQLSLFLQSLEAAETQPEAGPALYQEALDWMSRTLEHSSTKVADSITDFQANVIGVMEHLKDVGGSEDLWQKVNSRLAQEVSLIQVGAQNRVRALQAEFAALLETAQPHNAELRASMERFCQNAGLQSQVFQARIERMFQSLQEDLKVHSSLPSSDLLDSQPGGSLQEDFSVKLSALLQDILHSVQ
ncbi:uncharacterized protein V6R79_025656 [Siganus canaliculatus]